MTLKLKRAGFLMALAMVVCCGWLRADEAPGWPRFHGPRGDNCSTETGLGKQWPEKGPTLLWTAKGIGEGYSTVALADGRIYTAGNRDDATVVTALDLAGKIVWQTPCGKPWTASYPGTRSTPTLDGDRLYYETPLGDVVCLETATGKRVWTRNILKDFQSKNTTWALAESPVVDGDRLLCTPGGPKVSVVALDKKTGKTLWTAASAEGDLAGYATITVAEHQGLRIYLTMTSNALIGVDAERGELLFRHPHQTQYLVNATSPVFHDGRIFITSGYGTTGSQMLQLTVEGRKASVKKVWDSRQLDNQHGGVVLVDGCLYSASHKFNNGKWICLDWKTGEKKYAERGVGKGSLTFADGMLYMWSENRNVGLAKATPEGLKLAGEFKTPEGPEGPTWAHPVVCGGRLYLRHGDSLYAYDVKGK